MPAQCQYDNLADREHEKLKRLENGFVISGRAIPSLRDALSSQGCLWVPGRDKAGKVWAEGKDGRDLVALAEDEESKTKLLELVMPANARYESLALEGDPDFKELEEAQRRFAINRTYLRAWAHSAGFTDPEGDVSRRGALRDGEMEVLSSELRSLLANGHLHFEATSSVKIDESWQRKQVSKTGEPKGSFHQERWEKALKDFLYCAWTAETLITLQKTHMPTESLTKLSNNWSIVQLYYALHHLVLALHITTGAHITANHTEIHTHFHEQWQLRDHARKLTSEVLGKNPLRWWLATYRHNEETEQHQFHLGHDVFDLGSRSVSPWAPFDPLDDNYILSECLRNTREDAIKEAAQVWLEKKKAEEKKKADGKMPTRAEIAAHKEGISRKRKHTVLDYLSKFREHRNYEENISFVRGPLHAEEPRLFQQDFIYLATTSALLYETRIMAMGHPGTGEPLREMVLGWMHRWLEINTEGIDETPVPLQERLRFYEETH